MKRLFLALALILTALPAYAYEPVPGTPRTVIDGVEYGVWAEATPIGVLIGLFKNTPQGWRGVYVFGPRHPIQADIDAAGGVRQLILQIAPNISQALAEDSNPNQGPPDGTGPLARINQELARFRFAGTVFVTGD